MTNTMLEKAARALCRRDILKLPQFKDVGAEAATDDAVNTGWPEYIESARAALLAIREPDEAVEAAATVGGWLEVEHGFKSLWTTAIDAILSEGEA